MTVTDAQGTDQSMMAGRLYETTKIVLPAMKTGGGWRIRLADLERL